MKRYVYSNYDLNTDRDILAYVPADCRKYYEVDHSISEDELADLSYEYDGYDLELISPLVAKPEYFEVLDRADLSHVGLCEDEHGDIEVFGRYAYGGFREVSDLVPDIVKRDRRFAR